MNFNISADKPLDSYKKSDLSIILLTFLLWGIGMFTLYICSDAFGERNFGDPLYFVKRQLVSSAAGILAFIFFASINLETLKKILPALVISSIILCWLVFLPGIGIERNGARRWLNFGFTTFQPSEMVKFTVVLYLANYFEKQSHIESQIDKTVFPAVILTFIMVISIFIQQDLSTSVFVGGIALMLFIVSGSKIFWILPFMLVLIPSGIILILLEPYRLDRIIGFINQDEFLQDLNFQMNSARKAISAGGLWGQGLGSGLMKINSVPEIQSDYIFAGWAEAMGFCGVVIYFLILLAFSWRGFSCAVKSNDRFAAVASFGFTFSIAAQSVLNIAVVGGVVPTTGLPLPFFSSGGSSILFTFASCGFLLNASRTADNNSKGQDFENTENYAEEIEGEIIYE